MSRNYIISTWNNAAEGDYSGEMVGRRRRNGGDSQGFIYDRSTDDVYPEHELYTEDGKANLSPFKDQATNVDKALDYLEDFALKKKASFRLCEEALDVLDDILTDITKEDRNRLYLRLTDMRRDAYRATLSPEQRSENDAKDLREYILSLSLEERRDKYGPLCRNLGIPHAKERGAQNMNIIDLLWKVCEYGFIAVFIIYVFYIA